MECTHYPKIYDHRIKLEPQASLEKNSSGTESGRTLLLGQVRASLKMRGNPYLPSSKRRKKVNHQQSTMGSVIACCLKWEQNL